MFWPEFNRYIIHLCFTPTWDDSKNIFYEAHNLIGSMADDIGYSEHFFIFSDRTTFDSACNILTSHGFKYWVE